MCHPEHFGVDYVINPWMTNNIGQVDRMVATQQWHTLRTALDKFSVVHTMHGVQDLPDLVFTANAGLIRKNIAVLSKFNSKQRQPEEKHFEAWFNEQGYNVAYVNHPYEGEGDHLADKWGRHWMGTGFRSSKLAAPELSDILSVHINTLELVDPRWYHLDTCFSPLPYGELMWYPGAFSLDSQRLIKQSFETRIEVTEEDALAFSCNAVCLENHIFLPKNASASMALRGIGYNVSEFDLSEFLKAGGAAKCLVLNIGFNN